MRIFTRRGDRERATWPETEAAGADSHGGSREPAKKVKFTLGKDNVVVSEEVCAAFFDKPIVTVFPIAIDEAVGVDRTSGTTAYKAPESLDGEVIKDMLKVKRGRWKLAVLKDDAPVFLLASF